MINRKDSLPNDILVNRVMSDTGMGRIQAINHLRGRQMARDIAEQAHKARLAHAIKSLRVQS